MVGVTGGISVVVDSGASVGASVAVVAGAVCCGWVLSPIFPPSASSHISVGSDSGLPVHTKFLETKTCRVDRL